LKPHRDLIPALILLAAGTLLSCYVFVAPGHPLTVDAWPHLSRTKMVYEALRDGHSPFWSFMFYSGYPALRFYSPLFYFLGGTIALATHGDILLALRILLVALQTLSVAAMFLFLRRRTGDVQAAALGSLVYVLVPWRARHLGGIANYPEALTYLWLPLMFLVLDQLLTRPDRRAGLMLGLVIALSVLSHVVYAAASVAFAGIVVLHDGRRGKGEGKGKGLDSSSTFSSTSTFRSTDDARRTTAALALSAVTALALSAGFLVPFLAEFPSHYFPQPLLAVPGPTLHGILGFTHGSGGFSGGYLGVSVLSMLLAAVVMTGFVARRRYDISLMFGLALSLLFVFVLPRLGATGARLSMNLLPERFLTFFLFFAAVLVGSAWPVWKAKVGFFRRRSMLAFMALAGVIAVDCASQNLQNYNFPENRFLAARPRIYAFIASQDHSKILDLNLPRNRIDEYTRTEICPGIGFIYGDLPTPLGPFYHQFAPRSMLYVYPWINTVAADIADTTSRVINPRTLRALALMGVSHVLMNPTMVLGSKLPVISFQSPVASQPEAGNSKLETSYLVSGPTGAGMALASSRTRPFPVERIVPSGTLCIADDWSTLLDSLSVDDNRRQIAFIPVTSRQAPESLPGSPVLDAVAATIRNQDVTVRLDASCECFVRLAVSYYPELRMTLDGKPTRFAETKDHFIYLRCPSGSHSILVSAPLTPLRWWLLGVSGVAVVLLVVGLAL
jgi:hypothetical protein